MVYSYTPTYYSTLHDSITSLCKNLLPLSFKRRRLPSASSDHCRLSRLQSDNLKWQQDSFHQMLNLMGLHREGILAQSEVSSFLNHLLETLISSHPEQDHPLILRDKLLFLQELLYAKCISEEEYYASKRPLMERLSVQGAEVEGSDVIFGGSKGEKEKISEREWPIIELKDEQCLIKKENSDSKNRSKIKGGVASCFSFGSSHKTRKNRIGGKSIFDSPSLHLNSAPPKFSYSVFKNEPGYSKENPFWNGESKSHRSVDKPKRKPFRILFRREHSGQETEERTERSAKKQGFKKWKNNDSDDETAPLPLNERSDSEFHLVSSQVVTRLSGEETDNIMKKTLYSDASSPSDIFIDKVSADTTKKELAIIHTGQGATNRNQKISPRSDKHGDGVLDLKTQSKINVREMENMGNNNNAIGKQSYSLEWTTFEDDENLHPNLFVHQDGSFYKSSINPFCQ
ncbi:hypothetical protein QN277_007068 [Acacia crassicarpa]|uniref:Uncharacterized protein n=1 Tax=Acacia crassicarpa TaxID=499986 RepID=A0AAE1IW82_9FABA|nr:hypothetical protein QN277_007068 [Acacia crassicarpa]